MHLTREEERMLSGEMGEPVARALDVIVRVGEALGAERLIPISHAHVSGASYLTIGEPGLLFVKNLADQGARVRVFSTLNPVGVDLANPGALEVDRGFWEKQKMVVDSFLRMGFQESMTCTPYLIRKPRPGEHLSWGESSAVALANTYYGAHSNREGGPLALMSALTGRTYEAGMHLEENRLPRAQVMLEKGIDMGDEGIAGAVGYLVGEKLGSTVPFIRTKQPPPFDAIRAYTAAAGASGGIAMSVIEGVTPGWGRLVEKAGPMEKVWVEEREVRDLVPGEEVLEGVDLAFLGCPHASLEELEDLARVLDECGGLREGLSFWVSTSRHVYGIAREMGIVAKLEERGVRVIRDTCPIVSPATRGRFRRIATVSGKSFFYLPRLQEAPSVIVPYSLLKKLVCAKR